MVKILTGGQMPYSVVLLLSVSLYWMGWQSNHAPAKVAIAEKSAVILEAALNQPTASRDVLKKTIAAPIAAVIRSYEKAGYVVINTSKSDYGDMTVDALPPNTLDITEELRKAVKLPSQGSSLPDTPRSANAPHRPAG